MKTKQLVRKTLTRTDLQKMKQLTTTNLAFKILNIMKKHIGSEKAISRRQLFRKIFGRSEEITLQDELRWDYVKKAMHLCRKKTKCFIGNKYEHGVWKFFVLKDNTDAQYYIEGLNRNIKAMRNAQQRARIAVEKKYHEIDWLEEVREKSILVEDKS